MKITKKQLKRIIKEERRKLLKEVAAPIPLTSRASREFAGAVKGKVVKEQFGAINKESMSPLVQFAQSYSGLGDAIQSQLIDLVNAHIEGRVEDAVYEMNPNALDRAFERLQRPLSALAREGSEDAMDMMDAMEAAAEIFAQGDAEVEADARAAGDR